MSGEPLYGSVGPTVPKGAVLFFPKPGEPRFNVSAGLSEVGGRAERNKDVFRFGTDAFQSKCLAVPMAMADENGQQGMKERVGGEEERAAQVSSPEDA